MPALTNSARTDGCYTPKTKGAQKRPLFVSYSRSIAVRIWLRLAEFGVFDELVVQAADAVVQCSALIGYTLQVVGVCTYLYDRGSGIRA